MKLSRATKIPYAQVANHVLNDEKLSWKAKGIYAYLFSKPDDWDFSTHRIKNDAVDGLEALQTGIKELEKHGYLSRNRQGNGRVKYVISHAEPQSGFPTKAQDPESGNPTEGKPHRGISRPVSNTDSTSNTDNPTNHTPAPSADEEKQVGEVIFLFQDVNPTYKALFNRKPQREASRRLLLQFGMTKLTDMIGFLKTSNAARFAPTITTPCQLEQKLGELKAWADKQRNGTKTGKGMISSTPLTPTPV